MSTRYSLSVRLIPEKFAPTANVCGLFSGTLFDCGEVEEDVDKKRSTKGVV